jgi:transposase
MKSTMKKRTVEPKARKFTPEFKAGAVQLVIQNGRTVRDVAESLGFGASTLDKWVRAAKVSMSGQQSNRSDSESAEIKRLKREVRELEMERDILKKATAFFAKHSA